MNIQLKTYEPKTTFGVISDLHIGIADQGAEEDLVRALTAFRNRRITAVCCCGDIVDANNETYLKTFRSILDQFPEIQFFTCNGNHDGFVSAQNWEKYVKAPLRNSFSIGSDTFVFIPTNLHTSDPTQDNPYEDSLSWLQGILEQNAQQRIFLFIHFPLNQRDTANGSVGLKPGQYYGFSAASTDNDQILQMLRAHGNCVVFSGHSHYELNTKSYYPEILFKQHKQDSISVSYVHCPSLARPRDKNMNYIQTGHPELQPSAGYVVDAYKDRVKIRATEFNMSDEQRFGTPVLSAYACA